VSDQESHNSCEDEDAPSFRGLDDELTAAKAAGGYLQYQGSSLSENPVVRGCKYFYMLHQ
jgi:hypothetical protein